MKEGQKGGVFYTPTSIVRLIVEIIEPYHGRIWRRMRAIGAPNLRNQRRTLS
jgi:type I restriction-modification system DNA methylase subunit